MLEILALSYNDLPPVVPVRGDIPPGGGGIGRDAANVMVLPDPARLVSRRHGAFSGHGEALVLTNVSDANPFFVNDVEILPGAWREICDGDLLRIGGYVLRMQYRDCAAPTSRAGAAQHRPAVVPPGRLPGPFDDLMQAGAVASVCGSLADDAGAAASKGIPDDFDPFSDVFSAAHRAAQSDVLRSEGIGLDAVQPVLTPFSVVDGDPDMPVAALTRDPLLDVSPAGLAVDDSLDPLMLFRDERLAASLFAELPRATPVGHDGVPPPDATSTGDTVFGGLVAEATSPCRAEVGTEQAPPPGLPPAPGAATSPEALRGAFERGLGLPLPAATAFDAETLERVGQVLRATLAGMLSLMNARAVVKREVGAGVTLIEPNDNNPLKFSPDVEIALGYLFGRKYPGFMDAGHAVEDAFAGLRAHQLGMVAGMRAAMDTVIARFDPARVEAALSGSSRAGRILRALHKAECWDGYRRRYGSIAESLDDGFHDLYGKAFVQAYEEEARAAGDARTS